MKKSLIISVILMIGIVSASGQPCPDNLYITLQTQIDSFQIMYPNCTEIEGDVQILGNDITNLNGLSMLASIGGSLILGEPFIVSNPALTSLSGLDNVTSIGGSLYIGENPSLISLTGLDNVILIGENLTIVLNNSLTNLTGLEGVSFIGGGDLGVAFNSSLNSLAGIDNIEAASIVNLGIMENVSLSTCEVQSVCDYLGAPAGQIDIFNNATGCNSQVEVELACESVSINELNQNNKLSIYPNPSSTQITIETSSTPQKNNLLTIYNLSGQQLHTQPITEPQTVVDVSGLPSGVYFVEVTVENRKLREKLVVQ